MVPERIFHIATAADWRAALETGTYTTSTVGRTLAQEGFIHASRRDQVQGVFDRYYRGLGEDLVLLTIDPARLESEVRVEPVGDDTYPHVHGPINRSAVVDVTPLNRKGGAETLMSLWMKGMAVRMGAAVLVMLLVAAVVLAAQRLA
ncbi:hypothetical protein GCM10011376_21970 [Nocardioides flavus (ex Wang et al. 2016)]|uniref:DUF952 domain-containing protein n=1 Tax=Nocardioides flavus (ex Wang et al. 2016) TaxID=2058780 RepID=A0ABQ3HLR9_9ACTN|nr:DUF952 domain-containing protein [Nocardioides flavus (ex Wang et al. 2016)]GHE17587.1 hypothetical protein GCM10011376_21970 [Nocardioides flavus (ex Wang et al. 2016)]